jgi:hypothetical protein
MWYSIHIQNSPDKKSAILFGIKSGGIYVGWRGRFIDRGYTLHGKGSGKKIKNIGQIYHKSHASVERKWAPGHFFMKTAYEYQLDNYHNTLETEIQKSIDKLARKFSAK